MRVGTRLPGAWLAHALNGPIASSHGRAIVAPRPLSTVRRERSLLIFLVLSSTHAEGFACGYFDQQGGEAEVVLGKKQAHREAYGYIFHEQTPFRQDEIYSFGQRTRTRHTTRIFREVKENGHRQ